MPITRMKVSEATTYPLWIGTTQVTSANQNNIIQDPDDPSYNKVTYEAGTLTLSGAELSGLYHRIATNSTEDLTIELNGANSIDSDFSPIMAVFSTAPATNPKLIFKGSGYITLNPGVYSPAISGFDVDLTTNGMCKDKDFTTVDQTVTIAKDYNLTVKGIQVSSANTSDVLGNGAAAPTVTYDYENNKLTLNSASLDDDGIVSGLDNLTIHLKGLNYIGTDINAPVNKAISSTVSTAKLTFTSDIDVNNNNCPTGKLYFPYVTTPIDGFSDIVYEKGLDYALVNDYILGDNIPCVGEIYYGLTIGDTQVTSANYSPIKNGDGNSINASYNKDTHTLTIDGASWTDAVSWDADANLTVEIKGSNSITTDGACFTSKYSKTITFTQGDASNPCSLELNTGTAATAINVISGFANSGSPTMESGLSWIIEESSGNDVTKAVVAEDYKIEAGGKRVHSGNASDVLGDNKVTYNAESNTLILNGATITGAIWMDTGTEDLTVALNGTCSVTNTSGNYAFYTNGGKFNFVKASGATSAELTATCENGYPISFNSSSLGDGLYWALTTPVTTTSILITDDESKMLPAPTIAYDAKKDYLTTDKIAVTRNTNDATSTDIFYTWGDAVIGTVYKHDADNPTLTKYDGTNQIPAESNTLRAWVGYKYGSENYYVLSKAASQAFTVKTDIANCAIGDLTTTERYTGSKIEPTFTVTDGAKTLNKGTDYTVAYYKVENDVVGNTPVDMIEVGYYKIVISGIGSYGSTMSQNFEITQANLNNAIIEVPNETYTGNAVEPAVTVKLTAGGPSLKQDQDYSRILEQHQCCFGR